MNNLRTRLKKLEEVARPPSPGLAARMRAAAVRLASQPAVSKQPHELAPGSLARKMAERALRFAEQER